MNINLQLLLSKILQKISEPFYVLKMLIFVTLLIPMVVFASDDIIEVTITAYTPSYKECDSDPHITSSNRRVKIGYVALSRDLEYKMKLGFGDIILIPFEFQDRMNKRHKNRIDLFLWSKESAIKFGKRKIKVFVVRKEHWKYLNSK